MRAARLIAEDGLDYGAAKRKAAREALGGQRVNGEVLPGNEEIEQELRTYQALFLADSQPQRLRELRLAARTLMQLLESFEPRLVGAALNGTAGEHSDVHLELFTDSAKDVEIFLLNRGIDFDVQEIDNPRGKSRDCPEVIQFVWRAARSARAEGVHLTVFATDDLRGALAGERRGEKADLAALEKLLTESGGHDEI